MELEVKSLVLLLVVLDLVLVFGGSFQFVSPLQSTVDCRAFSVHRESSQLTFYRYKTYTLAHSLYSLSSRR